MKRVVGFFALWGILIGVDPVHVPIGIAVAVIASAVGVRLRPTSPQRFRALAMASIAWRLVYQAVVAGVDVAWRAFTPVPAVRPGMLEHPLRLPPGPARDAFCALMSLLPGTVPTGFGARDELLVHCLDVDAPVAAQLTADEDRFLAALAEPSDA